MKIGGADLARRYGIPLFGSQYCGDIKQKKVHDLEKEKMSCNIDEMIAAGRLHYFHPDKIKQALKEGYVPCKYCIGNNRRKSLLK